MVIAVTRTRAVISFLRQPRIDNLFSTSLVHLRRLRPENPPGDLVQRDPTKEQWGTSAR